MKEECHESENYGKEIDLKTTENNDGAGQSPIDLGASVTMSKDSLDEVGVFFLSKIFTKHPKLITGRLHAA